MYKHITIFLLWMQAAAGVAQTCSLSLRGQVNDKDNGGHLPFSLVSLSPGDLSMQTDEHGEFRFAGLCAGDYTLRISHVGCDDTSIVMRLTSSERISVQMPHSLNALTDVEVVGHQDEAPSTQAAAVLQGRELDRVRGADLSSQLALAPGMRVLRTGASMGKPMLNGMHGYRLLLLNHGVRLEGQQWGTEHAPEIDPFTARRITVLKGASSLAYGSDAIAGVVLLEGDELPDTAAVQAEVEGGYGSNGRLHYGAGQVQGYLDAVRSLSWRIQGSYRNGGDQSAPRYVLHNTGIRDRNFSAELGYHRKRFGLGVYASSFQSNVGILEAAHAETMEELDEAVLRGTPADTSEPFHREIHSPYQDISHRLLKAEADFHTGPRSRFRLQYAVQANTRMEMDEHEEDSAHQHSEEEEFATKYALATQLASLSWEHEYIRGWRGRFGVQGQDFVNASHGEYLIPSYTSRTFGVFAMERFVKAHYDIEGGVRYDLKELTVEADSAQSRQLSFDNLSYSLGALFRLTSRLKANINLGSGWRAPAVNELFGNGLHHGAAAIERGSPLLGKEQVNSLVTGLSFEGTRLRVHASASAYRFGNFIYYLPAGTDSSSRGAFPVFNYTQAPANIVAADAELRYAIGSFCDARARVAVVRGQEREAGQPLIFMPADRYEAAIRLHTTNQRFYIEPAFVFTDIQTRVPPSQDIAAAPSAYTLFNVELGAELKWGRQKLIFSASVFNALNVSYRDYLDRFRYFAHAPGRNVVLRLRVPLTLYDKR